MSARCATEDRILIVSPFTTLLSVRYDVIWPSRQGGPLGIDLE